MDEALLKLSPSSATDFKSCPQRFKFRSIDRIEEPVSDGQARGSLVHLALQHLFGLPPRERTPQRAARLVDDLWAEQSGDEEWTPSELSKDREQEWLEESRRLLNNLFALEDPREVTASRLEWWVEYELAEVALRGIIDRVEEQANGDWVLTDYKTGRVPGEARELTAFFGLRFYALVCWRAFGVMPREIRLVYLSDPAVLTLNPHERMLLAFEKQIVALTAAIRRALANGDWRARPSPFCMSCAFQALCPAWAAVPTSQAEGPPESGP
jgi:putative RecB family exonuclease